MKALILAAAASILTAVSAQAATVLAYTSVNGTDLPPSVEAPGVTGGSIFRGPGLEQNGGSTFNSRDWTVGADRSTAFGNGDILAWGFTSTEAYDLTSFDIRYDRSNTGPVEMVLSVSVNRSAYVDVLVDSSVSTSGETVLGVDLSAFAGVTSMDFILTAWGATDGRGTFDLENSAAIDGHAFRLNGDLNLAAVPLPLSGGLLLTGMGGLVLLRRRK